ncbi:MAG: bifunctional precorrin-2 dehydrogenase/sirohydrochlorin ferrochelatase [Bacteroidota bacterium]
MENNPLYPIFLKLNQLQLLVVGAGEVGFEKLNFLLRSSPNAQVTIVAPWMGEELQQLLGGSTSTTYTAAGEMELHYAAAEGGRIRYWPREFRPEDVENADLVIAATNLPEVNQAVWRASKAQRRIVNVADTPDLCDFYLGSIVTRGPLKVAVSTNGKSPTFAKRFRQWLEQQLPEEETPQLLTNLKLFRDRLRGDFSAKVKALNDLTAGLLPEKDQPANEPIHQDR